ncbi:NACHT domain-containing protein [Trebonia sp.]|uniref:NACHT domain-containing protein n=1 Tax=Trebonia sp. TaxID=2767075 RepID=UPI002610A630|nr:NACHT domain-containing protein [Trebonia sp.]
MERDNVSRRIATSEIVAYLNALIDWVSSDPWPQHSRFGGPMLTPAVIERKLRVTVPGQADGQDFDADQMAQQCRRLVVLGGPGTGKTWLAKRIARRSAQKALEALAAGSSLADVELPLYTTCSRLFNASGIIREAAVSSALEQLGDLGVFQVSAVVHRFFTARDGPVVLVIDSLDEAHGCSERLRQAGTLPWRIVLTSRPSSWDHQLDIDKENDSHRVGQLQPLQYPDDVEPFIHRWFSHRPEQGNDLAAQIARRPGLQKAATIPLILAFYCIVGGREPLPVFRHDLYAKVLRRMLTGRWRSDYDRHPDVDTCLSALRALAWSGATSHPVSGTGTWADDIPAESCRLGKADQDAFDHVAAPLGPYDFETGKTMRRFIHRSLREYLVAEHVASLPPDKATEALLPHLWYDPDWEYSAPSALAMHPDRDQLLQDLIRHVTKSDQVPEDLSAIDAGWQFRRFLARAASESDRADWSPDAAGLIDRARVALARSACTGDLCGAASWETSNLQAREVLLRQLADPAHIPSKRLTDRADQLAPGAEDFERGRQALALVDEVVQLAHTSEDRRRTRGALLGLLAGQANAGDLAAGLAGGLMQLDPTEDDKHRARGSLLTLLAREYWSQETGPIVGRVVQLAQTPEDKRQAREALLSLLDGRNGDWRAEELVGGLMQLDPTEQDKRLARTVLPRLLANPIVSAWAATRLMCKFDQIVQDEPDKRQVRDALLEQLGNETRADVAVKLASVLAELDPTMQDQHQVRDALLRLLPDQADSRDTVRLVSELAQFGPTAHDKRQVRETLLRLLATDTRSFEVTELVGALAGFDPTAHNKLQVREKLLGLLPGQTSPPDPRDTSPRNTALLVDRLAPVTPAEQDKRQVREALLRLLAGLMADQTQTDGWGGDQVAERLVGGLVQLASTPQEKRQAREALIVLLVSKTKGWVTEELASEVIKLDPTEQDKRQVREALLRLLTGRNDGWGAERLAGAVAKLDPTEQDKHQVRKALLMLLTRLKLADSQGSSQDAARLTGRLARLDPAEREKREARDALLRLLACQNNFDASKLVDWIVQLASTEQTKRENREALLNLLTGEIGGWVIAPILDGVLLLGPTTEDKHKAREALLTLLAGKTRAYAAEHLVGALLQLDPTAEDKRRAREVLRRLSAGQTRSIIAGRLVNAMVRLDPTVRDLNTLHAAGCPVTMELLSAAHRNSALDEWLGVLPSLKSFSG